MSGLKVEQSQFAVAMSGNFALGLAWRLGSKTASFGTAPPTPVPTGLGFLLTSQEP